MKLSIHWTLRSGTGQAGPSGVKPEAKPQLPLAEEVDVPERDVLVGAQLEELVGNDGPEAEQAIAKLLAANVPDPNRNEDKPDSENEHIDVVKKEKNDLPLAPVGEPPSNTTAPSDEPKEEKPGKRQRTGAGRGEPKREGCARFRNGPVSSAHAMACCHTTCVSGVFFIRIMLFCLNVG